MDINEIENLQNESGLFNLDDIQTLFYEVSYYQDINEENIAKEKESKKESNSYAEKFNEYNRILPGYAVNIRNLEEEVKKIDDKQQHLGGRISEKDKTRKTLLLEQIEDLKKKYQEDRINREEARKGHKEAKEENEKAKMVNEEALAKKQLEFFRNKIVSVYKYCLSKNKEIDDKLAVMEFLINNETSMERKVQYSLEYYNLGKLKINNIENYKAVMDKIRGSEVYDDIKPLIEQAEIEVQNQQLEGYYDEEVRQLQQGYKTVEEPVVENIETPEMTSVSEPQSELEKPEEIERPTITMPEFSFDEPSVEPVENMEAPEIPSVSEPQSELEKPEEIERPTITMPEFSFDEPSVEPVENMETPEMTSVSEPQSENTLEEPKEEIKSSEEKNKKKHSLFELFSLKNDQEENMIMDGILSTEEAQDEASEQPEKIERPTITMPEFSFDEPNVEDVLKETPQEEDNNAMSEEQPVGIKNPTITMPEFSFDEPSAEDVLKETSQEEDSNTMSEEQPEGIERPTITMPEFSFDEPSVEETSKETSQEEDSNTMSEEQPEEMERPTITMPEFSFDEPNEEEVSKETPQEDDFMNPFEKFNYSDNKEDEILNSEVKPEAILSEDEWTDTKEDLPSEEPVSKEASSEDALDKFNSIYNSIDNGTDLNSNEQNETIYKIEDVPVDLVNKAKVKFQKMWFGDNYDVLKEQGKIR